MACGDQRRQEGFRCRWLWVYKLFIRQASGPRELPSCENFQQAEARLVQRADRHEPAVRRKGKGSNEGELAGPLREELLVRS
jgi:hypothetical protein